jgi:hypothetical protein
MNDYIESGMRNGWGMGWGMGGIGMLLITFVFVLAIIALVKYIRN